MGKGRGGSSLIFVLGGREGDVRGSGDVMMVLGQETSLGRIPDSVGNAGSGGEFGDRTKGYIFLACFWGGSGMLGGRLEASRAVTRSGVAGQCKAVRRQGGGGREHHRIWRSRHLSLCSLHLYLFCLERINTGLVASAIQLRIVRLDLTKHTQLDENHNPGSQAEGVFQEISTKG